MILAAIDAGGTTFKCALVRDGVILDRRRVPTTQPDPTIEACTVFFEEAQAVYGPARALGIGCFGPLDTRSGAIGTTPKQGWSGTSIAQRFESRTGLPVALDLDVHASLLAETKDGAAKDCNNAAYITIGTGVGAGLLANGEPLAQPFHPEFGHIPVQRHPDDTFSGVCPFHADCLEGLVSAPALQARFGALEDLPANSPAWSLAGFYLAQACLALCYTLRPQRIVLGGGLMEAEHVLGEVRRRLYEFNARYLPLSHDDVARMVVRPAHGGDAGLMGAYYTARAFLGE